MSAAGFNLNPSFLDAFLDHLGIAFILSLATRFTILLSSPPEVVFFVPNTFGPNVRDTFAQVSVAKDDIARLKVDIWEGSRHQDPVGLSDDIYTCQHGYFLSCSQRASLSALIFPRRIYARVATYFPVRNNTTFAGAGVILDDWKLGFGLV